VTCDHDATRASLPAFLSATTFLGFVIFPGEVQAQARCNGCDTTLAVVVDLARGHAVRGEIPFAGKVARHLEDIPEDEPPPVREPIDWNDPRIR
jgi:hypothetical protein